VCLSQAEIMRKPGLAVSIGAAALVAASTPLYVLPA
jgi:hypothetical protein